MRNAKRLLIVGAVVAIGSVIGLSNKTPDTTNITTAPVSSKTTAPVCTTQDVPYRTHITYSDSENVGYTSTTIKGEDGLKRVCTKDGVRVSDSVIKQPVTEEVLKGTYVKPAPTQCAVTLCNDGTCSFSQGRGTCSWHGGVAQYY